jgi:hypothetical protein
LPPELIISDSKFEPMYQTLSPSRTLGGAVLSTENGDPYWECEIGMERTTPVKAVALRAWKNSLRGGQKSFLAHHHARPAPSAYANIAAVTALTRAGGGAFDGTAVISAFPDIRTVQITAASSSRLPAGFQLRVGDMLGIVKVGSPNKYLLHQVMADITAAGDGSLIIDVEPRIITTVFAAGNIVNFIKPLAEFKLMPSSDGQVNWQNNSFSISGTSVI